MKDAISMFCMCFLLVTSTFGMMTAVECFISPLGSTEIPDGLLFASPVFTALAGFAIHRVMTWMDGGMTK